MGLVKVQAPAGFHSQSTEVGSGGAYLGGNLIRWRQGDAEKLPGWLRLTEDPFASFIRRKHAWLDLSNRKNLMVGTDVGLELLIDTERSVLANGTVLHDPRRSTWFLDNMGEDGLAAVTLGPLLVYHPSTLLPPSIDPVPTAPGASGGMFVAMPQAQVITWGTEPFLGTGVVDPLLLRWSDVGTYDEFIAAVTNQAGSYRLSRGSKIMGGIQAPQTTLIFTDTDVWAMNYIGPPLIYGFTIIGAGCGLVAPHAVATLGRTTYWQGPKGIWQYGDGGVQQVPSTVHDYIFEDLDNENIFKCHAGANSVGNEVTFYFPSRKAPYRSDVVEVPGPPATILSNEPTRYAKLSPLEPAWDSGILARTAWINSNVFGNPLGSDLNFRVQQHEIGFDDDDQPMRGVYLVTGYSDIGDGTQMVSVDQCQPDFKWFGKNGGVNMTLRTLNYASAKPVYYGPFSMTDSTQFFNPRTRSRYLAIQYDWAARRGFSARVGSTLLRVKPAGRRP